LSHLKVEIYVPLYYNDKTLVEKSKFILTFDDIFGKFNACTMDSTPLSGDWRDPKTGIVYHDQIIIYWVVCEDLVENREFPKNLKETLKERFCQEEMMMVLTNVDLL
jgi:mRNA-degrading endonuclease YafQ of YafQ-DinJ toxin-antitoxin module